MRAKPRPRPGAPTALVTGAGRGIGAALAGELARAGWRVAVADVDAEAASAVAAALSGAVAVSFDVSDAAAWVRAVGGIEAELGPIGLLANNAGVGLAGPFDAATDDDWRRVVDVNLWGVVNGVRAVAPGMCERGFGWIVNVASGAALAPRPGMVPYAMTKAAVVGLSVSLRAELAARGVRVTAACPGYVGTGMLDRAVNRGVDGAALRAAIPFGPMSPERCAERILRAAARDTAVAPVGGGVALEWRLARWAPALVGALARLRARSFARAAAFEAGVSRRPGPRPGSTP